MLLKFHPTALLLKLMYSATISWNSAQRCFSQTPLALVTFRSLLGLCRSFHLLSLKRSQKFFWVFLFVFFEEEKREEQNRKRNLLTKWRIRGFTKILTTFQNILNSSLTRRRTISSSMGAAGWTARSGTSLCIRTRGAEGRTASMACTSTRISGNSS